MKGFSHFMSGVAVASFGPWAIDAALNGNPMFFILGGACGILPDTLDFKFYRFFYEHDVYVMPDPKDPNPQKIAEEVARAIQMGVDGNRYIRLKLGSIRLGTDFWQQYQVTLDNDAREVVCRLGPVVNTGQVPVEGTENPDAVGRAPLPAPVIQTYDAKLRVDIFDGPTIGFAPRKDGGFDLEFLPWHREWSHALTVGLFLGLLWALVACCFGAITIAWQGLVTIAGCYAVHVVEDQMGHMGSNLFYPFTKHRAPGLHWMHSGDGLPNFTAVWLSCILIFWNLAIRPPVGMSTDLATRTITVVATGDEVLQAGIDKFPGIKTVNAKGDFAPTKITVDNTGDMEKAADDIRDAIRGVRPPVFSFWKLMLVALVVPYALFGLLRWLLNRGRKVEAMVGDDADDEWNEMKAS